MYLGSSLGFGRISPIYFQKLVVEIVGEEKLGINSHELGNKSE
jgi:hypothetical protein